MSQQKLLGGSCVINYTGPMDRKEERRLVDLMDEVSTPESDFEEQDEESEPYSTDDDQLDPNYGPDGDGNSSSSSSSLKNISQDNNEPLNNEPSLLDEPLQASVSSNEDSSEDEWVEDVSEIPDFHFDDEGCGIQLAFIDDSPSSVDIFEKLWDDEIMDMLETSMNKYADLLQNSNRPHQKNSSCAYQYPVDRKDRLSKVRPLLEKLLLNYRNAFFPNENLSLDESLLLFRGRLSFRIYIKNKRARYGIKFYSLCTPDGYVLNLQIYSGKGEEIQGNSKIESLVISLLEPYLDRGHHVFMDNFYNGLNLCKKLLKRKTHCTGTLRRNRKGNPTVVTTAKLRKGEHVWRRCKKVYVSKWKDKREVLSITTKYHPKLITTQNKFGQEKS
ncbi:hypothetical protein NQ315_004549 [Exocentrus adspersus]|uniref:PiggyBac transposable element-derived protein domain-containing protein n=1 Tax=Exocentrus adspersus TaxID=1586481 RepID=A0AAV8V812_9CUCU|nr:hypothetical protein NQ315_004549 [Exocentrus adspersus]